MLMKAKRQKGKFYIQEFKTAFGANVAVWSIRETACGRGVRQE